MQRAPLHQRAEATARGRAVGVRWRGLGLRRLESRGCNDPAWTRGSSHLPGSGTSHRPPWPRTAIQAKLVIAAAAPDPEVIPDDWQPPQDLDAAFAKRYLLVTPENVQALAEKHPKLFE